MMPFVTVVERSVGIPVVTVEVTTVENVNLQELTYDPSVEVTPEKG